MKTEMKEALETKVRESEQQVQAAQQKLEAVQAENRRYELAMKVLCGGLPQGTVDQLLGQPSPKASATMKAPKKATSKVKASDKPPKMTDRLKAVMGQESHTIAGILSMLEQHEGWYPSSSKDPKKYISAHISQDPSFVRVGRGLFAVVGSEAEQEVQSDSAKEDGPSNTEEGSATQSKADASGKIPKVRDRLIHVIGDKELRIAEIIEELKKRDGWLPESNDISTYMCYALGNKEYFEKVSRGCYKLVNPPLRQESKTKEPIQAKSTNGTPNKTKSPETAEDYDTQLKSLHEDEGVTGNPFAD